MISDAELIKRALDSLRPNVPPAEWEAYETVAILRIMGFSLNEISIIKGFSIGTAYKKIQNLKK